MLRVDPEDVMRQVQDFEKQYKVIPLTRMERAYDLRNCIGSARWSLICASGLRAATGSPEFEQARKDWTMMWSDLEPVRR